MSEEERQDALEKALPIRDKEIMIEELEQILSLTIKQDYATKMILFLGCLLTYTETEQVNFILSGESAIGKTFTISEVAWFFPEVISLEGASKTAFIHEDSAILVDRRDMTPIDILNAPKKKSEGGTDEDWRLWQEKLRYKAFYNDYSRRIIMLPDMPDTKLLATLRSLTDHSKKRCTYSVTQSKSLKTKKVIIDGFFTPIYCTASTNIDEQEITRFFLLTPEFSETKIKEGLDIIARKNSDEKYKTWYETEPSRVALKERVKDIKSLGINEIFIPLELMTKLRCWFDEHTTTLKPKATRDFPRLISLTKAWTLLNHKFRNKSEDEKTLYSDEVDVEVALKIYEVIYKSNELGLTPECYDFYENVVVPIATISDGATLDNFHVQYFQINKRPLGDYRLKGMLKTLETIGLLTKETSKKPHKWMVISQKENGKQINTGQTPLFSKATTTNDDKLRFILDILQPNLKLNLRQIEKIVEESGNHIKKEDIPKLLVTLSSAGKVHNPNGDDYTWQRAF